MLELKHVGWYFVLGGGETTKTRLFKVVLGRNCLGGFHDGCLSRPNNYTINSIIVQIIIRPQLDARPKRRVELTKALYRMHVIQRKTMLPTNIFQS